MAALRWDQLHHDLGTAEQTLNRRPTWGTRMACAEDDDPARGIVLGVAASLFGFWVPLVGITALRWAR